MRTLIVLLSLTGALGCGSAEKASSDTAATVATDTTSGAMAGMDHAPAKDADNEFLRQMSDHHEGLVMMASVAMTKATKPATQADAHMLHTKQAAERDSMLAMLRTTYDDKHTPTVMPKTRLQNDSLQRTSGPEYDRTFYRLVVEHHREALAMIDSFRPRLTRDDVKRMADMMKKDQQKEIADFQRKAGA